MTVTLRQRLFTVAGAPWPPYCGADLVKQPLLSLRVNKNIILKRYIFLWTRPLLLLDVGQAFLLELYQLCLFSEHVVRLGRYSSERELLCPDSVLIILWMAIGARWGVTKGLWFMKVAAALRGCAGWLVPAPFIVGVVRADIMVVKPRKTWISTAIRREATFNATSKLSRLLKAFPGDIIFISVLC